MHEIRQMIGVCPQQDVLFDLLSVKEHLQFFAAVKVLMDIDKSLNNNSTKFLLIFLQQSAFHRVSALS